MRLTNIDLSKIRPNPDNPRGIDIQTQDEKLSYLKDSIAEFGVMVPIVVSQKGDTYLLIDGERRYWAAKAIGLNKLPAFVIDEKGEYSEDDILYRTFKIHHNREQWGPVQQCHALENLYNKVSKTAQIKSISDERAKLAAIAESIVEQTGIEERTALTRVYFLRWPKTIKHKLYSNSEEEGYWYICEIEEKIIIPALINYPEYFQKVPVDEVRTDLFEKLQKHSVERSTDVRRVAPFFRAAMTRPSDRNKVKSVLRQLQSRKEMTYVEAQEELVTAFPEFLKRDPISPRKLHTLMRALQTSLDDFDVAYISVAKKRAKADEHELKTAVTELMSALQKFNIEIEGTRRNGAR